jgi:tetratricopeptide (TPR) repeat protein
VAKACYLKALEVRRDWVTAEPQNKMVPQNVAESLGRLGSVCLTMGQLPEARAFFEESLALREQWQTRDPNSAAAQQELAGARSAMGRISLSLGRLDDAERYSQAALEALTRLLEKQPTSRSHRWNTALFSSQLGAVLLMAGKATDAVGHYERALQILAELSQQDPQNALLRRHLAETHYGIASSYTRLGSPAAAEHHQTALELRQRLVADDPTSAEEQTGLMSSLACCGRHAEASQIAQTLQAANANDGYVLYKLAAGFALCASAAARQPAAEGSPPSAAELVERYAQSAMEALRTAVASGFQLTAEAALDPDFEYLHDREDFRKLLDEAK